MNPEQYQRVKRVFQEAMDVPADRRESFVENACGDDDDLLAEVRRLLTQHEEDSSFLEDGHIGRELEQSSKRSSEHSAERGKRMPERIEGYRILDVLGRGGMGIVYLAEQDNPRRTVALKVIRSEVASRQVLRRFEHEAQVLGRLHHPSIAQVYEAGTFDEGEGAQPYFAMEYVEGLPLDAYASEQRIDLRGRLELLEIICDAVHHAHLKGVIHRDLKPANILIDERGRPKILDFGVARVTNADIQVTTLHTIVGQMIGTLPYMSPEQVEGDPGGLDTRSDVYSLGVIAYELLAASLPFDLHDKSMPEAARIIRDEDPTTLSSIDRSLRGDVETIVAKALDKNRERRYQSAAELAADIRRYLNDEPIVARPASTWYQMRKFSQRHTAVVVGAAVVFLVLVAGVIVSTTFAISESRARTDAQIAKEAALKAQDTAETAQDETEAALILAEQRREEAQDQAEVAQAINNFLNNNLLSQASPYRRGPDVTVRELIDVSAEQLDAGALSEQPLASANARFSLGSVYAHLGLYEKSINQYEIALRLFEQERGDRYDYTLSTLNNLALAYSDIGRLDDAEQMFSRRIDLHRSITDELHQNVLTAMNNLALVYYKQGRLEEAEILHRKTLEGREKALGDVHFETILSKMNLANTLTERGRYREAGPMLLDAVEQSLNVFGEEDYLTVDCNFNLAQVYYKVGNFKAAESILIDVVAKRRLMFGDDHPKTLYTFSSLGLVYNGMGRYDEAEPLLLEAVQGRRMKLGENHQNTLDSMSDLAWVYYNQKRFGEAEIIFLDLLQRRRDTQGSTHPNTLTALNNIAAVVMERSPADAMPYFLEALEIRRSIGQAEHPDTLVSMANIGAAYLKLDQVEEAEAMLREAVTIARTALPEGHWHTGVFLGRHGTALRRLERYEEAEQTLLESHRLITSALGESHGQTRNTVDALVKLYEAWDKLDQAAEWRAKLPVQIDEADSGQKGDI